LRRPDNFDLSGFFYFPFLAIRVTMKDVVLKYVSEWTGVALNQIKLSNRVEQDFGLAGLDTLSFYEGFFEKFETKKPEDFKLDRYSSSEGLEDLGLVIKSIFSAKAKERLKADDVTIGHLLKVAEQCTWTGIAS